MRFILPEYSGAMQPESQPTQSNRLNNRDVELRLQHAIQVDQHYSKRLSIKCKHLHKTLEKLCKFYFFLFFFFCFKKLYSINYLFVFCRFDRKSRQ